MASSSASTVAANADLVEEILTWLPPRSVVRFKSVCRRWHDLSSTTSFVATHTRRNPHKIAGFLWLNRSHNYTSMRCFASYPLDNSARRAFPDQSRALDDRPFTAWLRCCNGLVLFTDPGRRQRLWVYNPTTRQGRILPDIQYASGDYVVLGFEPSRSPHYRVVIASPDSYETNVYSSETGTSECFSIQQAPWINHPRPWKWHTCFCNGVVYWLDDSDGSLFSFNIEQRSVSRTLMTRPPMHNDYVTIKLQESRGRLLLFRQNLIRPTMTAPVLQVLEMTSDHSRWLLLHTVPIKDVLTDLSQAPATVGVRIIGWCFAVLTHQCCFLEEGDDDDDVLLVCDLDNKVVAYDLTRRRRYDVLSDNKELSIIWPCSNTLVPP